MWKNYSRQGLRYDKYSMSFKEYMLYGTQAIIMICLFGYFFYRSLIITVFAFPLIIVLMKIKETELINKRKVLLQIQFKDVLVSVNSSIKAGYSLENAFCESLKDVSRFYGEDSVIAKEILNIKNGLSNNRSLTSLLYELGKRSDTEDIKDFAEVLSIGKKTGGNIGEILDSYIRVAEEKVSVLEEIETIISAKKYEQKIMNGVPFFIIFYIELTTKGFFNCLYHGLPGRIIMTICLFLYLLSIYMSAKIVRIKI